MKDFWILYLINSILLIGASKRKLENIDINFYADKRRHFEDDQAPGSSSPICAVCEQTNQQQVLCTLDSLLEQGEVAEIEIIKNKLNNDLALLTHFTREISKFLFLNPLTIGSWLDYISSMSEEERTIFLKTYSIEQTTSIDLLSFYRVIPLLVLSPTDIGAKALLKTFDEDFEEALENWNLVLIRIPSLSDLLTKICSRMSLVAFLAMDGLIRWRYQAGSQKFVDQFGSQIVLCNRLSTMAEHVLGINVENELALVATSDMDSLVEAIKAYHWINREGLMFEVDFLIHMQPSARNQLAPLKGIISAP